MLFRVKNLIKTYQGRTVLDLPDLSFEPGLIYSLLGPNGSGKTTLLEILSLLTRPSQGRVFYNDEEVKTPGTNNTDLRREIVMVHQNPILFSTTVYKNLEFGLKIRSVPSEKRDRIIDESLDLVGMKNFRNAHAHKLSGGESQRVAIARALACSPKVIFFDEPTASVDVENQIAIERIMTGINEEKNISVIFTTHNLTQASKLSNEIIALYDGKQVPSIYENIFSVDISNCENGYKKCLLQDTIELGITTEKTGKARIAIDPYGIKIPLNDEPQKKEEVFKGRLIQLTVSNGHLRAIVDIGIPLNIILSWDDWKDRILNIGDQVNISIPWEKIRVL